MLASPIAFVPQVDEALCLEAASRASGASVHLVNNLLQTYRMSLQMAADGVAFRGSFGGDTAIFLDHASRAELQLRAFVARQRQSDRLPLISR